MQIEDPHGQMEAIGIQAKVLRMRTQSPNLTDDYRSPSHVEQPQEAKSIIEPSFASISDSASRISTEQDLSPAENDLSKMNIDLPRLIAGNARAREELLAMRQQLSILLPQFRSMREQIDNNRVTYNTLVSEHQEALARERSLSSSISVQQKQEIAHLHATISALHDHVTTLEASLMSRLPADIACATPDPDPQKMNSFYIDPNSNSPAMPVNFQHKHANESAPYSLSTFANIQNS